MIAFGNNIYRTLNDKFYLGTQQIGKVYKGTDLIYPESSTPGPIEPNQPINNPPGFKLNGNIYDSGYMPTKYTCCEICFKFSSTTTTVDFGDGVFGTNHNAYHSYSGSKFDNPPSYRYNSSADNSNWNNGNGRTNVAIWKNKTSYHWVMSDDRVGFRFGGEAVQGDGNLTFDTATKSYINDSYNTDKYDSIILLSNSNTAHYNRLTNNFNWTDVTCDYNNNRNHIQGKYFTLCVTKDRWGLGKGVGEQIASNCFEWCWDSLRIPAEFNKPYVYHTIQGGGSDVYYLQSKNEGGLFTEEFAGNSAFENIQKKRSFYSSTEHGGNLWIGGVNFNDSASTTAIDPNPMSTMDSTLRGRNHITWNTYQNNRPTQITFSTDIQSSCFKTPNIEWVYIIIYDYDDNETDGIARESGTQKRKKYLYVPRETEIGDSHNTGEYYVAFWKYDTDANGNWNTDPCEVIYPFTYVTPSNS